MSRAAPQALDAYQRFKGSRATMPAVTAAVFYPLSSTVEQRADYSQVGDSNSSGDTNKRIVRSDVESSAGLLYSIRESELLCLPSSKLRHPRQAEECRISPAGRLPLLGVSITVMPWTLTPLTKVRLLYAHPFMLYKLRQGITNLIQWAPLIWRDRDWDWAFLARILEFKFRRMSKSLAAGSHLRRERDARQCLVCAELAKRLAEDNYFEMHNRNWKRAETSAKNDQRYLGLMIGKFLRHWWD